MGLRTYLQQRKIIRENQMNSREKAIKNWSQIRSILILCSVKTADDWDRWNKYFVVPNSTKRDVFILGFNNDLSKELLETYKNSLLLNKKDLNWFGMIKNPTVIQHLFNQQFDLVLDFNLEDTFLLNWIYVKTNASLRVGPGERLKMNSYFDLIINMDDSNTQPKLYLEQIINFLEKINLNG